MSNYYEPKIYIPPLMLQIIGVVLILLASTILIMFIKSEKITDKHYDVQIVFNPGVIHNSESF